MATHRSPVCLNTSVNRYITACSHVRGRGAGWCILYSFVEIYITRDLNNQFQTGLGLRSITPDASSNNPQHPSSVDTAAAEYSDKQDSD